MPDKDTPLYSRGKYRLDWDRRKDGSLRTPFLQIVWYDDAARRNRSRSTGTGDVRKAEEALDRLYLERERGQAVCPTCGKPVDAAAGHLVTQAIADYLVAKRDVTSYDAIKPRLSHVFEFLEETGRLGVTCDQVDEALIAMFRAWSAKKPVIEGKHARKERERAPGTTEASVRSLAAAIRRALPQGRIVLRDILAGHLGCLQCDTGVCACGSSGGPLICIPRIFLSINNMHHTHLVLCGDLTKHRKPRRGGA